MTTRCVVIGVVHDIIPVYGQHYSESMYVLNVVEMSLPQYVINNFYTGMQVNRMNCLRELTQCTHGM